MRGRIVLFTLLLLAALAITAVAALAAPPATAGASRSAAPHLQTITTPTGAARLVPTVPPPTRVPTQSPADDLARVKKAGKILVGTSLDNPPFSSYDEQYAPSGFDVALMSELAGGLGVKPEFNDFAFEGLLSALKLGQVDAAIAAITMTAQRMTEVDFTNPYYAGEDGWLAAKTSKLAVKTPKDLAKQRIGVQLGSVYETLLQEALVDTGQMPSQNLMSYLRPEEAVRDLSNGNIDLVVLDLEPAKAFTSGGNVRLVGQGLFPQVYSVAVRKGSSLLPELNKALLKLQTSGAVADLALEYLDVDISGDEVVTTPTPVPTPAVTPTPPPCVDGMAYVADLNYDDKNMKSPPVMQPGQKFNKAWRIRNSGNCNWSADFALSYVRGNTAAARMGGQDTPVGRVVAPGQTIDISVPLVAPQAPGVYQGFWQMKNPKGTRFGETIWVGIQVPAPPTPVPPPPPPGNTFTVDRTTINAGECVTFSWNVTNVKAVYFYPQGQPYQQYGVAGQASKVECPPTTTIYTLRVQYANDQVQEQHIQINVNPIAGAPQIAGFNSSPEFEVTTGQCANFWWDVRGNVSRVALVRSGTALWDYAPVQGSKEDCPPGPATHIYELQVWGPGGFVKASRQLNVRQGQPPPPSPPPPVGQPEILRMSAPEQAAAGTCVWVSWDWGANVAYARLLKNGQLYGDNAQTASNIAAFSGNANGDCSNTSPGIVVYRLEGFNTAGASTFREVRVQIIGPQPR
jgi:ABC-type amino acid transport substrate-binding protein